MFYRVWIIFLALMLLTGPPAQAADNKLAPDFSFLVFGDSRLPGYAPYGRDQKDKLEALLKAQLTYAYGSAAGAEFTYRFDPSGGELKELTVRFPKTGAWRKVRLAEGWPTLMTEGIGKRSWVSLRGQGQEWVYRSVLAAIAKGCKDPGAGPLFCLHTGDIVYNGLLGKTIDDSPFWKDFITRFLSKLPKGGPEGLPARFFPAPGNHESWGDEELVGFRQALPYLAGLGFSENRRVYKFDHKGCRFIFLDTGDYVTARPSDWGFGKPDFKGQMAYLTKWLTAARAKGIKRVFITFHNAGLLHLRLRPSAARAQSSPVHQALCGRYAHPMFTGHVHPNEAFMVKGEGARFPLHRRRPNAKEQHQSA